MTLVMGVLDVAPDPVRRRGRRPGPAPAVARGRELVALGADVVDVRGACGPPGAAPVPEAEELRRVLPVVEALAPEVRVAIDTARPAVAVAAAAAGASIVDDRGGELWQVAAGTGVGWVAVHGPAGPAAAAGPAGRRGLVTEVCASLVALAQRAAQAGVEEVWIDPGIGLARTAEDDLVLLGQLGQLTGTGWPVAVGTGREPFPGMSGPGPDGGFAVADRLEGSLATAAWAALHGAAVVRAHDVAATAMVVRLAGCRGPTRGPLGAGGPAGQPSRAGVRA